MVTYSLVVNNEINSDNFYINLGRFAQDVVESSHNQLGVFIEEYIQFIKTNSVEKLNTYNEYLLELVMIGVFTKNYIGNAHKTNKLAIHFLQFLYAQRKKRPNLKAKIDILRGYFSYIFLEKRNNQVIENYSLDDFNLLLNWLQATGEFNEEVIRLTHWLNFLKTKDKHFVNLLLSNALRFAISFEKKGHNYLNNYVENVSTFRSSVLTQYKHREDYFLAGRHVNEYYLNMFGAELLNGALRNEFSKTTEKVLLLPTCMQKIPVSGCKAATDGKELVCAACSVECNIGKVATEMRKIHVTTYLIPHSSDFSRFLKKWENNSTVSLIGVACVLNLLTGGYEMKRLNISSQCVFLDYCGCKKHWDVNGFATSLNINQLRRVVLN